MIHAEDDTAVRHHRVISTQQTAAHRGVPTLLWNGGAPPMTAVDGNRLPVAALGAGGGKAP